MKTLTRLSTLTAALCLTAASSAGVATGASAATTSRAATTSTATEFKTATTGIGPFQIENVAFSQCIDAPGGALNVRLRLAPCSPSSSSTQLWTLMPIAPSTYTIVNKVSGFCMEVNNGTATPGETVDQFTCNGLASEQWVADGISFRHQGTNQCLDTVGGAGSQLMQFTCGQAARPGAQSWFLP